MKIRLAQGLQQDSIVDGQGLRTVIWTQGCAHNCPGCHNPKTHDFNGGFEYDVDKLEDELLYIDGQDGITLSGGDPFYQAEACAEIANFAKMCDLNVWCYTGFTFEELQKLALINSHIKNLLNNIDVLVDGMFVASLKSYNLRYRGSANQRIIDVKASLRDNTVIVLEKYTPNKEYKNLYQKKEFIFA